MKRITATNQINGGTFGAKLEDPTEWINKQIEKNSWGKPARQIFEDEIKDFELARATGFEEIEVEPIQPAREVEVEIDGELQNITIPEKPAVVKKRYDVPADYEIEIVDITEQENKKAAREAKIAKGKARKVKCQNALDYVAGFNDDNEKTEAEIDAMVVDFAEILGALQQNRSSKALRLINLVNDVNYADLKAELIEILEGA